MLFIDNYLVVASKVFSHGKHIVEYRAVLWNDDTKMAKVVLFEVANVVLDLKFVSQPVVVPRRHNKVLFTAEHGDWSVAKRLKIYLRRSITAIGLPITLLTKVILLESFGFKKLSEMPSSAFRGSLIVMTAQDMSTYF